MKYIDCLVISAALMAISLLTTMVIESFIKEEEKGLYVFKVTTSVFLNGLFVWVIVNMIKI